MLLRLLSFLELVHIRGVHAESYQVSVSEDTMHDKKNTLVPA